MNLASLLLQSTDILLFDCKILPWCFNLFTQGNGMPFIKKGEIFTVLRIWSLNIIHFVFYLAIFTLPVIFVLFSSSLVAGPVLPCKLSWILLGLGSLSSHVLADCIPNSGPGDWSCNWLLIAVCQSGLSLAWTVSPYVSSSVTLVTIIQCIDRVTEILHRPPGLDLWFVAVLTPIVSPRTHIIFQSMS